VNLPCGPFATLYADPPWPEYGGGRIKRGADRHYKLMCVSDIKAMGDDIQNTMAPDSHCYLWVTNNYLPAGLEVLKAWGYRYITTITWAKDKFGLGQYYRGQTEHCLFGVRGRIPYRKRPNGKRAQGVTIIHAPRRKHSQKPDEMREMIEVVSPPPYLELFARERAPGWIVWGDEVGREPSEG